MGKYSDFEKVDKDFYATIDPAAMDHRFLDRVRGYIYAEPCYGNGDLENLMLTANSDTLCIWRSDVRETVPESFKIDAMQITETDLRNAELIITNPPYSKNILLPMIEHFTKLKPTWLLLPADMMHNIYFAPYMRMCQTIVSVGRLYWQPNKVRGKSNFCWYYWPQQLSDDNAYNPTKFIGRKQCRS